MLKRNRTMRWLMYAIVLGTISMVSGCDLSLLEELLPKDGFNSTDSVQGTVTGIETFTMDGVNDTFTISELNTNERAIIAISPWDLTTVGDSTNYSLRINKFTGDTQSLGGKLLNPQTTNPGEMPMDNGMHGRLILGSFDVGVEKGVRAHIGMGIASGTEGTGVANVGTEETDLGYLGSDGEDYFTYDGTAGELDGDTAGNGQENLSQADTQLQSTETRTFYVREGSSYKTVTASRVKTGEHLYMFLDDSMAGRLTDTQINGIIDQFDHKIYSAVTGNFGSPRDVDGNGKVILLITPLLYKGSTTQLVGYFDERDFHDRSTDNRYTNTADMIYLNASVVVKGDMQTVYGNIAHEFQHLVFFSEKCQAEEAHRYGDRFSSTYSDVWINEGFSMLAAHLTGYINLASDWRIYDGFYGYFSHPEADGLLSWEISRDSSNYGSAGLFAYYLYDHYRTSIKKIAQSSTTFDSVLKQETGKYFDNIFRNWMVANMSDRLKNVTDSLYRYNGINLKSSPAVTKLLDTDSTEIKGMGVKYYVIDGEGSDVTINLTDYFGGAVPESRLAVIFLSNS